MSEKTNSLGESGVNGANDFGIDAGLPGRKALIDLIDLDVSQRTADALGRDLDIAENLLQVVGSVLRTTQDMELTHFQRKTINDLLLTMLENRKKRAWEFSDIPF